MSLVHAIAVSYMGQLLAIAAQMDAADLDALCADEDYPYREEAKRVREIRQLSGFDPRPLPATPATPSPNPQNTPRT